TRSSFVDDLTREFKVDDIVCAKVINPTTLPVFLSPKEQNLGVIRAFCEICNVPLIRMNNKLKCPECGRIETRKISSEYGKGLI
ncbi:MAG: RNA-binding protein, partial [Thermoplasmata archaeon]